MQTIEEDYFEHGACARVEKKRLRKKMRTLRDEQNPLLARARSRLAEAHILTSEIWENAKSIGFYMPLQGEADCRDLLQTAWQEGKKAFLPKIVDSANHLMEFAQCSGIEDFAPGSMNIMQPTTPAVMYPEIDLLILPGLAFDCGGTRLGYGCGYYDRYLDTHPGFAGVLMGFCHQFQMLDNIPADPWDVPMQAVCTECGIIPVSRQPKN